MSFTESSRKQLFSDFRTVLDLVLLEHLERVEDQFLLDEEVDSDKVQGSPINTATGYKDGKSCLGFLSYEEQAFSSVACGPHLRSSLQRFLGKRLKKHHRLQYRVQQYSY